MILSQNGEIIEPDIEKKRAWNDLGKLKDLIMLIALRRNDLMKLSRDLSEKWEVAKGAMDNIKVHLGIVEKEMGEIESLGLELTKRHTELEKAEVKE
jgi:hypothetical protein